MDCSEAKEAPGVVAILTAVDATEDGITNMVWTGGPVRDDGGVTVDSPRPLLNGSEIRHLGEPLAMLIATSKQAATDAAELIDVNIEASDTIALSVDHMLDGPLVWPETEDNIASLHALVTVRRLMWHWRRRPMLVILPLTFRKLPHVPWKCVIQSGLSMKMGNLYYHKCAKPVCLAW